VPFVSSLEVTALSKEEAWLLAEKTLRFPDPNALIVAGMTMT
jgi:hypothetical protein